MSQSTFKIKPRFNNRLVRKFLVVFLALLLFSILVTAGFMLLYLYLFLPAYGVPQNNLQPFLRSLALQSLGVLAAALLLSGLIYAKIFRSLVREVVNLKESLRLFTGGNWAERVAISRNDEVGMLAYQYNLLAEELTALNNANEKKLQEKLCEIEVTASVANFSVSAPSKQELLQNTVRLMVEHLGYHEVSVFLIDETAQYLVLTESFSSQENQEQIGKIKFRIGSQTIIGWVCENHKPSTIGDVSEFYSFKRTGLLNDTLSEAAIPLLIGGKLLGVINVQSKKVEKFGDEQVAFLQNLANLLATALRNIDLQACTSVNIEEAALLYNLSQKIAKSESIEEIFQIAVEGLGRTDYYSIFLTACSHSLEVVSIQNPDLPEATNISNWPLISLEDVEELLPAWNPIVISNLDDPPKMPGLLIYMLREWQAKVSALVPVTIDGKLIALFVIATKNQDTLSTAIIQPYANLAELMSTAIQKIQALQLAEKRQTEIQALQIIGEAVAGQTTIFDVYTAVHKAIQNIIGDVNFLIALYNKDTNLIQIPYLFEGSEVFNVDPFPLGEGLTSILIKTRQPLMLVHDTERRTRELGAKIVGAPAKSWLGVPMSLRGEILGALIIQDLEKEGRFTEEDQQLLLMAGAQVGSAVQTARLLEQTTRQADREKQLHEITKKIRGSTDVRTILATTASEIGKSLGIFRTSFEIGTDDKDSTDDSPREQIMEINAQSKQNGIPDE